MREVEVEMPTVAVRSQFSKLSFKGQVGIQRQDSGLLWYSEREQAVARRRPRGHRFKVSARRGEHSKEMTMGNVAVQKKETEGTPIAGASLWDPFGFMQAPFGFMQEMFGWGRSSNAPSFDVKESNDAYVCKVKVKLTLPDQADVAHVKAELDNGELTLVVPKAAAATPEPASPPPKTRRTKANRRGSAAHKPRRGTRTRSHRR